MTVTPPENAVMPDDFDPETDHLSVERTESGLVVVTLNYPERRNAMSGPMTVEIQMPRLTNCERR